MERISLARDLMEDRYDVIVIGSGYGGSISASRMARAGKKVCLLERGSEILPGDFPDDEVEALEQLQIDSCLGKTGSATGLYNIHINKEQSVVVGCGLGGTSLINANVSLKPQPEIFEQSIWPTQISEDADRSLAQGYERALNMLKALPYPVQHPELAKFTAHKQSAAAMGAQDNFYRPPINVNTQTGVNHVGVTQPACNNCGDCISGCNTGAKNTTLMNYLPDAYNHDADIFCEISVKYLEQKDDGWLIYFQDSNAPAIFDQPLNFVKASIVIISAGTLGSNEIMLRSKQKGLSVSGELGKRFTGNGDVLGFGYNCDQPINGIGFGVKPEQDYQAVGPCITSIIDLRNASDHQQSMVIEEGSLPSALANVLPNIFSIAAKTVGIDTDNAAGLEGIGDSFKEKMRVLQSAVQGSYKGAINHTQTYLIMSHDDAQGKMHLEDDKLRIDWPNLGTQSNFSYANSNLIKATKALGGTFVKNPIWDSFFDYSLVTVHPLGGCAMSSAAETGVVNHKGQVFSGNTGDDVYQSLYITDGSIIPTSLAVNPLLTISALSERCCALIAKDRQWHIDYTLPSGKKRAIAEKRLGIEFTERMQGTLEHNPSESIDPQHAAIDVETIALYEASEKEGKTQGSRIEFILTVSAEDLDQLIESDSHNATMSGTVSANGLSSNPLSVSNGTFNLFVDDPERPDSKRMNYQMQLTSSSGKQYFFNAYKFIKQGDLTDIWPATTTLYVQIFNGTDTTGNCVARGVMHIKPLDFAKQMTTMKALNAQSKIQKMQAITRFGEYFAGALWQSYAGIFYQQPLLNPEAAPRKLRPLRAPAPQVHWFKTQDNVDLRLTRYHAGSKGPVMLVHGLGVSAKIFSTDTIETNLTEYLCAHDYDVWLLDFRVSIDLPSADQQSNADQVAQYDFSAAIDTIRVQTKCSNIQAVVHCYGATTFFMSLLKGLKHIRSVVCSQIATHLVIPQLTDIKTGAHLPSILQKLGIDEMSAYTDTEQSWADKLFDKTVAINALSQGQGQCNSSVCHRITFLYSSLFRHQNLNQLLHNNLHELFAQANISSLKHLAQMCRAKKLVDVDGNDSYLDDQQNWQHLNLPIRFISGQHNDCYLPQSTAITYQILCEKFDSANYSREVIAGYGHIDCIIGAQAVLDVYPKILAHLDETA
jgi:cholesterol oxidase